MSKEYNYAVRLLSSREYCVSKMRTKLLSRTDDLDLINQIVDELIEKDYLSDQRYAISRIKNLMQKGFSTYYIKNYLAQEGLNLAIEDIDQISSDNQIHHAHFIEAIFLKKLSAISPKDESKRKDKMSRYMLNKGHSIDLINKLWQEHAAPKI